MTVAYEAPSDNEDMEQLEPLAVITEQRLRQATGKAVRNASACD